MPYLVIMFYSTHNISLYRIYQFLHIQCVLYSDCCAQFVFVTGNHEVLENMCTQKRTTVSVPSFHESYIEYVLYYYYCDVVGENEYNNSVGAGQCEFSSHDPNLS